MADRKLLNHLYDLTEDINLSMEDIACLKNDNPKSMLYVDVTSEEEFKLRHHAMRCCLNRDFQTAIESSKTALGMNPDAAYLFYIRGKAYTSLCMWDEGIKDLQKAIELKPDYFRACLELGVLYFNKGLYEKLGDKNKVKMGGKCIKLSGDFKKAEETLLKARDTDPTRPESYELLWRIYYFSGKQYLAKQNSEKAMKLKNG
ncbi:MAG: hypothetical protein KKD39_00365 [Candidatus Altiarchaeota archaeon]|nr:hypothetical protein [Candidatus Altiarchaeota archaeon]